MALLTRLLKNNSVFRKVNYLIVLFFLFLSWNANSQDVTINSSPTPDTLLVFGEDFSISGTYNNTDYSLFEVFFVRQNETFSLSTPPKVASYLISASEFNETTTGNWSFNLSSANFPSELDTGYFQVFVVVNKIISATPELKSAGLNIIIDRVGPVPEPTFPDTAFNIPAPTITGTYSNDLSNGTDSIGITVAGVNVPINPPQFDTSGGIWTLDFSVSGSAVLPTLAFGNSYSINVVTYDTTRNNSGIRTNVTSGSGTLFIGRTPELSSPIQPAVSQDPTPIIKGRVTTSGTNYVLDSLRIVITPRVASGSFTYSYPSPNSSIFSFSSPDTFQLDLSAINILTEQQDTFDVVITTYDDANNTLDNSGATTSQFFIIKFDDTDGDGISDFVECNNNIVSAACPDSDGDGTLDYLDTDSDNDMIPDSIEKYSNITTLVFDESNPVDTDNDGLDNYRDTDSDADGILDIYEAGQYYGTSTGAGDTIFFNADRDSLPNHMEVDADNDYLLDVNETNSNRDNSLNTDGSLASQFSDIYPDYLDSDSDNDKIADSTENSNNTTIAIFTSSSDGIPDFRDFDSDDDGILDSVEAKGKWHAIDSVFNFPIIPDDFDGDGTPNYRDLNSDSTTTNRDPILDQYETAANTDGLSVDTLPNYLDFDSDNDGISDLWEYDAGGTITLTGREPAESTLDTDAIYDFMDADSDGDGLKDSTEARGNPGFVFSGTPDDYLSDGTFNHLTLDSDKDSIPDGIEGAYDSPLDLADDDLNFLDDDSDGDGLLDSLESGLYYWDFTLTSGNSTENDDRFRSIGDSLNSLTLDSDGDGYHDSTEFDLSGDANASLTRTRSAASTTITFNNEPDENDGDGIWDFLDPVFDAIYGFEDDPNTYSIDSSARDYDSDLLPDDSELTAFGQDLPAPSDFDNDGYYNFADRDSDGDGKPDIDEPCDNPGTDCPYLEDITDDLVSKPLGFTPNGDGANDGFEFDILTASPQDGVLQVFNRWGQVVYEANPYPPVNNQGRDEWWEGTNQNGKALPAGTYYYLLEYTDDLGKKKTLSNYIYIRR